MFRKLRTHLVLINLAVTTIILVIAFATIYTAANNSVGKRPIPRGEIEFSQPNSNIIEKHIQHDRQESLKSLLASLITVGVLVEIAVAALSFCLANIAIKPIQKSYNAQKNFVANASHEIKTPLAAISANLEAANIQNNRWLDNVNREVQILSNLNNELIQLAQIDNINNLPKPHSEMVVQELLGDIISLFEAKISTKKLHIEVHTQPKNAKINTVAIDLRQVLTILLDNAIKYGQKNLKISYKNHEFRINNDGKTIPAEKIPQVFDRFYQVDKSSEGSGLGLAIAKEIAKHNNWKLELSSRNNTTTAILKIKDLSTPSFIKK